MKTVQSQWEFGMSSDCGPLKKINEDFGLFRVERSNSGEEAVLAVVADGMGGYQAGGAASRIAVEMIVEWWESRIHCFLDNHAAFQHINTELNKRLFEINERLYYAGFNKEIQLGTTLSLILLFRDQYVIAHVGDSRIYQETRESFLVKEDHDTEPLFETAGLKQLTEDHSWVQSQIQLGRMTKEEARNHGRRNVLLQCLGVEQTLIPYQAYGRYHDRDLFLLCSDGFHSMFSDRQIDELLKETHPICDNLKSASDHLVKTAVRSGATDNITVLLLQANGLVNRISTLHRLKYWFLKSF